MTTYISGSTLAEVIPWCLRHQTITWINGAFGDLRPISQAVIIISTPKMNLKSTICKIINSHIIEAEWRIYALLN